MLIFLCVSANEQQQAPPTFETLLQYCEDTAIKKQRVAQDLGVTAWFFTELLHPETYRPKVPVDLVVKIARLINQPVEKVIEQYSRV